MHAFALPDVMRLAKQHVVDRHVVDELGPVSEVVPVGFLDRLTPHASLRVELEALPVDHLGELSLDRVVMRLKRMTALLCRRVANEAAPTVARDQHLPRAFEQCRCLASLVAGDVDVDGKRLFLFVDLGSVGHGP
ncbi:hypothetical protein [Paraburkholderia dipogonis]|uniref:hypothetical protein n=1 Tax=Paraburkholderia dipogonis TaxID=1211383 RepID=UPI0038BCD98C